MKMSKSRMRIAAATAAGLMVLAIGSTSANAATVLNRYERTCNEKGNSCGAWKQTNGAYNGKFGSTCVQYNRQFGWFWVVKTVTTTNAKAGGDCRR